MGNTLTIVPVAGAPSPQWRVLRHSRPAAKRLTLLTEVLLTAPTLKGAKAFVKSYTPPPDGDESDGTAREETPGRHIPGPGNPEDAEDGGEDPGADAE
jgi:hypothetical protein